MREEKHKKCDCDSKKREKKTLPPQKLKPPVPTPSPDRDCCTPCNEIEIICSKLCGNIFLNQDVNNLEIWKKQLNKKVIVSVSVFNSTLSTAFIRVTVFRLGQSSVVFKVPRGNTLSATVEDATTISVFREEEGVAEGTFCLEVCFPFQDNTFFLN